MGRHVPKHIANGPQVSGAGMSQCGLPARKRVGAWTCPVGAPSRVPAGSGYCSPTTSFCWDVYRNNTASEFAGSVFYGYGEVRLGEVTVGAVIVLRGYQSVSNPVRWESTGAVTGLRMSGERYYWSPMNTNCAPVSPSTYKEHTFGRISADHQATWPKGGYKARETTVHVGAVVHEYHWTVFDYPGDWWLIVKSVHFRKTSLGYRYAPASHLCHNPTIPGYTS